MSVAVPKKPEDKPKIDVQLGIRIMQEDQDRLDALADGALFGIDKSKIVRAALRLGVEQLEKKAREAFNKGMAPERPKKS